MRVDNGSQTKDLLDTRKKLGKTVSEGIITREQADKILQEQSSKFDSGSDFL